MKIKINNNFSLGMSLPSYVESKIEEEISKYLDSIIEVNVFFSKDGSRYKTNIVATDGSKKGITIKSSAFSEDIYHSFDLSLIKMLKQLRKYKSKLLNYRKEIASLKAKNSEIPYIIADRWILRETEPIEEEQEIEEKGKEQGDVFYTENNNMLIDDNASLFTVIEEKETKIEELNIEEALMKMDLLSLPAYMFINKDNGLINVIYKKSDNTISWINPKMV